eukprot:1339826-Amorphochlora_amoeboformis.AAC.1
MLLRDSFLLCVVEPMSFREPSCFIPLPEHGVHRRESDLLLRLLTPVAKIYASKCCVMVHSTCCSILLCTVVGVEYDFRPCLRPWSVWGEWDTLSPRAYRC